MTMILSVGRNIKCTVTLILCQMPFLQNSKDIIFICISKPTNGAKYLMNVINIVDLLDHG